VKKTGFILLLLLTADMASGQQLPLFSQYVFNKFLINPAVAGSDGYPSISLTAREQWVGETGAPRTFLLSYQTRLLKKKFVVKQNWLQRQVYRPKTDAKVGFGGYIFNDVNGLIHRTGFQACYSYHMWIPGSTQVSLGLAFTGYQYRIDDREIKFEQSDEPWLYNSNLRRGIFVPDFSFGAYVQNAKYSAGFSAEQLFEAAARIGSDAYKNYHMSRHYYIFGSYNFEAGRYGEIQPSFLFTTSEQFMPVADIGLTYLLKNDFWSGLSFRTSGAIIGILGARYQNIYIGYSFDFSLQEIQRVTYGTHELSVALRFGDSSRKFRWLDRY
jgi:type IX secretion system PorP/SprF family membrane protein